MIQPAPLRIESKEYFKNQLKSLGLITYGFLKQYIQKIVVPTEIVTLLGIALALSSCDPQINVSLISNFQFSSDLLAQEKNILMNEGEVTVYPNCDSNFYPGTIILDEDGSREELPQGKRLTVRDKIIWFDENKRQWFTIFTRRGKGNHLQLISSHYDQYHPHVDFPVGRSNQAWCRNAEMRTVKQEKTIDYEDPNNTFIWVIGSNGNPMVVSRGEIYIIKP